MRSYLLTVLLVLVTFTSCDTFNLRKPAYLRFSWKMFNQNRDVAYLTSGYFHLEKLEFYGDREEGPEVLLEQVISDSRISFSDGSNLGFSLDIPAGRYEYSKLTLKPNAHFEPCMTLMGYYRLDGEEVAFRIEWDTVKDLVFDPTTDQVVTKKKTYGAWIGFDEQQLFQSVNWVDLTTELENGNPVAVISQTSNVDAFEAIETAMDNAFVMTMEQL